MALHDIFAASFAVALSCTLAAQACGSGGSTSKAEGPAGGAGGSTTLADAAPLGTQDFDATADDFQCITRATKVRSFFITNRLGKMDETLAIANAANGGTYPVGTMIQLIPTEAMVKRRAGFSAETNDWEFFSLGAAATGTTIVKRGTTDVVNQFNGNCFDCHKKAEPQFDFVCESNHGCDPLPLTPQIIDTIQQGDPRCP